MRMPRVLLREDKGTRVCLAISRQEEGRMLLALSLCGPAQPKHKFQHLLYF